MKQNKNKRPQRPPDKTAYTQINEVENERKKEMESGKRNIKNALPWAPSLSDRPIKTMHVRSSTSGKRSHLRVVMVTPICNSGTEGTMADPVDKQKRNKT